MFKRFLPLLILPILAAGCNTTLTNLTPKTQIRNATNLYQVEVALSSHQQTLNWDSIQPQIVVGNELYKMRPTQLMTNRWEGFVPVPATSSIVHYRYKFDYRYNAIGSPPLSDSILSPEYILRIVDK